MSSEKIVYYGALLASDDTVRLCYNGDVACIANKAELQPDGTTVVMIPALAWTMAVRKFLGLLLDGEDNFQRQADEIMRDRTESG